MSDFVTRVNPTTITLIPTRQCTAACPNCSFQCTPKKNIWLPMEDSKRFIKYCLQEYPSVRLLVITGGECTLKLDELISLIQFGVTLGLRTRIVTNAYWAKDEEKTGQIIQRLVKAGLNEINISTGDEHLQFVPLSNVVHATTSAIDNHLICVINIEKHSRSKFTAKEFSSTKEIQSILSSERKNLLIIKSGLWVELRTNQNINYDNIVLSEKPAGCDSILGTLCLNPYGYQLACCGLTVEYIPELIMGKISKPGDISRNLNSQYDDLMKIWIFSEGASTVIRRLRNAMNLPPIENNDVQHSCVDCLRLFRDKRYAKFLRDNLNSFIGDIMMHYNFRLKHYNINN